MSYVNNPPGSLLWGNMHRQARYVLTETEKVALFCEQLYIFYGKFEALLLQRHHACADRADIVKRSSKEATEDFSIDYLF